MELSEGALGDGEDMFEHLDEEEDSEEEEDLMYYGPPPIPLKLYIDKITDWFHPFDVYFIYFTRLDRGPIRLPENLDVCHENMSKVNIQSKGDDEVESQCQLTAWLADARPPARADTVDKT